MKYQTGAALSIMLGLAMNLVAVTQTSGADVTSVPIVTEAAADVLALDGDAGAGEKLYRRNCRGCHGATAKGASSYPKLVGHSEEYLIDKLVRYRAGEKFGPNTPLMAQRVKRLSDQDLANVTAFVLSLAED